jgi:membrane associated rhomboid family serine protease
MILLVPTSPEVPKSRAPKLWPALVTVLLLAIAFIEIYDTLMADGRYIESLQSFVVSGPDGVPTLKKEAHVFLKLRPLLRIAPAKGDWDLERVIYANFIHGSFIHLFLNLIGVFAGMRICATFIPFGCSLSIFLVGGSLGLLVSLLVSTEVSEYIPHVGASAGLFALMGTYYIYNFRYRTRYFFWFPSKQGFINLKTSWFFFLDVIMLEVVLSAGQFFPQRLDSVDHIAHVVGFASGMGLALFLRAFQRWPGFLQTRGEFLYWATLVRPKIFDPILTPLNAWLDVLEINPYNDLIKLRVCRIVFNSSAVLADADIQRVFKFFSPTFIRLQSRAVSLALQELLANNRTIPVEWLVATPYDSVIRLARYMTTPPEAQPLLFKFVSAYRKAHPEGGDIDRKLELLMTKLSGAMPFPPDGGSGDGMTDSGLGGSTLRQPRPTTSKDRAKRA